MQVREQTALGVPRPPAIKTAALIKRYNNSIPSRNFGETAKPALGGPLAEHHDAVVLHAANARAHVNLSAKREVPFWPPVGFREWTTRRARDHPIFPQEGFLAPSFGL